MGEFKERGGGSGFGFGLGLMAGTLFGIGLGMLLAPKSGSELRNDIGTRARRAGDQLANQYRHANDAASAWAERGREVAERGRVAFERGREAVSRGVEEAHRHSSTAPGQGNEQPSGSVTNMPNM